MKTTNTYAVVDLDALRSNYRFVKGLNPDKEAIAIVKADSYGHGSVACARALYGEGVRYFAVANLDEAEELLGGIDDISVLILGYIDLARVDEVAQKDIITAVYSLEYARALDEASRRAGKVSRVHIKVNTGMNRLGFDPTKEDFEEKVRAVTQMKNLTVHGIFSHYSTADEEDLSYSERQREIFEKAVDTVKRAGAPLSLIHISNSAAAMVFDCPVSNAFRPGLVLYGYSPLPGRKMQGSLRPVMSVYAHIANIFELKKGESISYGRRYTADSERRIATVTIGYADGYSRSLSNRSYVMAAGSRAPVRGSVCMDMIMCDITGIDGLKVGDTVEVLGPDVDAQVLADLAGTIPYEITCDISKRVKRYYREEK